MVPERHVHVRLLELFQAPGHALVAQTVVDKAAPCQSMMQRACFWWEVSLEAH